MMMMMASIVRLTLLYSAVSFGENSTCDQLCRAVHNFLVSVVVWSWQWLFHQPCTACWHNAVFGHVQLPLPPHCHRCIRPLPDIIVSPAYMQSTATVEANIPFRHSNIHLFLWLHTLGLLAHRTAVDGINKNHRPWKHECKWAHSAVKACGNVIMLLWPTKVAPHSSHSIGHLLSGHVINISFHNQNIFFFVLLSPVTLLRSVQFVWLIYNNKWNERGSSMMAFIAPNKNARTEMGVFFLRVFMPYVGVCGWSRTQQPPQQQQ